MDAIQRRLPSDALGNLKIPAFVRDQLTTFRDLAEDRNAAVMKVTETRNHSLAEKTKLEGVCVSARRSYGPKYQDDPQTLDKIAMHGDAIRRCDQRLAELQPLWTSASHLVRALEAYILDNSAKLARYAGPTPALLDGETALAGIDRAARRARALRAERQEVLAAPFPGKIAKASAVAQIKARADLARPDVANLVDRLEPVVFNEMPLPTNIAAFLDEKECRTFLSVKSVDVVGLLAWLFPAEFEKRLAQEIDDMAEDDIALDPGQRAAKLATIDADILVAEREEAHFCELAGLVPRHDLDPRAVLKLADSAPAPRRD